MSVSLDAVYAIILTLISGVVAAVGYWRRRGNETWQMVEGRIYQAVHFTEDDLGRAHGHFVRVSYSYQLNGEFYSGELVRSFPTEGRAEKFADRYKKDLPVIIRIHHQKPDVSVLREDDNAARLEQASALPPTDRSV